MSEGAPPRQLARFLRSLSLLLLVGCDGSPARPNVLLVTIDTLRADQLGVYGAAGGNSSSLDALAADAVVFDRAIAASSRTAPSHASIFTSRWARDHSVGVINGSSRLGDETTLAGSFADAGWSTAAFVSNAMLHRRVGLDSGFAHYDARLPDVEVNRSNVFERLADKTTRQAIEWLEQGRERPWFLWVQYNDPHGPYTPPAGYAPEPTRASVEAEPPLALLDSHAGEGGVPLYQRFADERSPARFRARYEGEIRYMDEWLGRLLASADAQSEGRETIVLVTADHGEALGEEDRYFQHGGATTPNLVHVPLILRAPAAPPARYSDPVHHVDLAPTLLELAGLPPLEGAAGVSLVSRMMGGGSLPVRTLYADNGVEVTGYRGEELVRKKYLPETEGWEFSAYRWDADGLWTRSDTDSQLEEQVRRYTDHRVPMVRTRPMSAEMADRLRSLGYVE